MNLGTSQSPRPGVLLFSWGHTISAVFTQPRQQQLWAHLLVCVQMSTLVWGCRMTSREAMASV